MLNISKNQSLKAESKMVFCIPFYYNCLEWELENGDSGWVSDLNQYSAMNEAALRHTWKGSDMGNHKLTFPENKAFYNPIWWEAGVCPA